MCPRQIVGNSFWGGGGGGARAGGQGAARATPTFLARAEPATSAAATATIASFFISLTTTTSRSGTSSTTAQSCTAMWQPANAELNKGLEDSGLCMPAALTTTSDNDNELRSDFSDFFETIGALGSDTAMTTNRLDSLLNFYLGALDQAHAHLARTARTDGRDLSRDLLAIEEARRSAQSAESDARAQVADIAELPLQRWGKTNRRREVPRNPTEREQAEEKATARWSRELLGLLVEADLPLAKTLQRARRGAEGAGALRCSRGQLANTFKQRVTDWPPFRCLQRGITGKSFQHDQQELVDPLEIELGRQSSEYFLQVFVGHPDLLRERLRCAVAGPALQLIRDCQRLRHRAWGLALSHASFFFYFEPTWVLANNR